jgi:SNF2 family DNA or RNA helicase
MSPSYYQETLYFNQYIEDRAGILTDMPEIDDPHPEWPPGILFKPTWDIKWQYDFIARMHLMGRAVLAADMGLGKTVMSLGAAAVAFEFGLIDLVVVVCEKNKLSEWVRDFGKFTRLSASLYYGPKRKALLGALPQALVTTYETARTDVAVFPQKGSRTRKPAPGPLMEAVGGLRVMLVYDEVTKVGHGRGSKLYKAHKWMEEQLRAACRETRVIGLTGTPMDTDLEGMYNELRIVVPQAMPTVKWFEDNVVRGRDVYGRPSYRRDGMARFREVCDPYILRKRKSDPDVRDQFPPLLEEFRRLQMHDDQYRLYRMLEDLAWNEKGERQEVPGLGVLLRLLAGDPLAVLESAASERSALAVVTAEELGDELARCSSAKAEELISMARILTSGGGKMMVFTFFARTVLPVLARRLAAEGLTVFTYHGGMTQAERDHQLALFEACEGGAVLVLSDAGARGINVPFVDVIAEYEPASKHSVRVQRANRGHRLGRMNPLTFVTLVLESTIESASSVSSVLARGEAQDFMLHDDEAEGFTTAGDRRELYAQARPRKAS